MENGFFLRMAFLLGSFVVACSDLGASSLLDRRSSPVAPIDRVAPGGVVLDGSGRPAPGVPVRAFPAVTDVAALVANSSAGLVSNSSAGLVSNSAAGFSLSGPFSIPGQSRGSFSGLHVQAAVLETVTGADGRFGFDLTLASGSWNVEAVRSADSKAILMNTKSSMGDFQLTLTPTGTVQGRVVSDSSTVTDLLGVDVFVPGTAYSAKTDASGSFSLPSLPAGTFDLVAMHPDLGRGFRLGIKVNSREVTRLEPLTIQTTVPRLASISPASAGPGQQVTLLGTEFGVSRGKNPVVLVNGLEAMVLKKSDTRLVFRTPAQARSGIVWVKVGEIPSVPVRLQVASECKIVIKDGDLGARILTRGDVLAIGSSRAYTVRVIDHAGAALEGSQLDWAVSGGDVSQANGVVRGGSPGSVVLSASLGTLVATLSIEVVPYVESLALGPVPVPELETYPANEVPRSESRTSVTLTATTRFRGSVAPDRNLPVIWSTADARIRIDSSGSVRVEPGAATGSALVQARCVADPTCLATLSVPVTRKGDLRIEIE